MSNVVDRPRSTDRPLVAASRLRARTSALPWAFVAVMVCGYAALFSWLSLSAYWALDMHALDMGNMGQAAWNTIHGHPFYFTNMRLPYAIEAWNTTTRLSFHVEALFPVISLVYVIYGHPESLLILQTVALALGAVAVFLLAREIIASVWLAAVFVVAYLLYPALEGLNLYEFHPVALATPLLLFAFLFLWRRQLLPFVVCCLAAMGTKEEIGLIVAMFGLYAAFVHRERVVGLSVAAVGIAWSLIAVLVIEHHFRQPGSISYVHTRYAYLGSGVHGAVHTVFHDPGIFAQILFTWPKLGYLVRLLAPFGFLSLLDPVALLLGLPTFALNLLSQDFHMYTALGDNSAELISVVVISAILGARTLIRLLCTLPNFPHRRGLAMTGVWLAALAVWNQVATGFTPIGNAYQVPMLGQHQHLANAFLDKIPDNVPVATTDQLDPHLSSRHYVYLFNDTGRIPPLVPANYILLDVSAPTYPLPSWQLHDYAEGWIHAPGWGVAAADDGLILIKKGARSRTIPQQFYSYALGDSDRGETRLSGATAGLRVLGYERTRVDLANHTVPSLGYSLYFKPAGAVRTNLQPVLFETMGKSLMGCVDDALGLSWLPTSQWVPGVTYTVRMNTLETNWATPGTAQLSMDMIPTSLIPRLEPATACRTLWARHTRLWQVGTLDVQF